ncbi:MAG: yacG [Phycisphaerales bacterium]|nr:yacG [Phycisphaerales bacterium]
MPPTTACPTCKRSVPIPADDEPMGAFPFCCERCKLVDLGRWMDGQYQIPVADDDLDEQAGDAGPAGEDDPPSTSGRSRVRR